MIRILTLTLAVLPLLASAQDTSPRNAYESRIETARHEYRKAISKQIRSAKSVELVLLRFDDVKKPDPFNDDESRFPIAPYGATCGIISTKKLNADECKDLLLALADQIEKRSHTGGAFCHYPIHGIRIYTAAIDDAANSDTIYTGSFCWVCKNFGFAYPDSAEWLDTTSSLHDIFNKLLPIPDEELRRFKTQFKSK
ncbi:hypothetical protein Poly59_31290 [Rubripirellula reticaptiva]|uniref:Uncharacterized protein n=1 Tax=Rubripirellula reticaptiva TaxID=2528013 RepID=A0A5C6ETX8_9BACT|nr:hypothetical protein Poly59_31290 [Rubripirellula reticaptiva]